MSEDYLNTHTFIYADVPINDYSKFSTTHFKCHICGSTFVCGENPLSIWNRDFYVGEMTCGEVIIKDIIE